MKDINSWDIEEMEFDEFKSFVAQLVDFMDLEVAVEKYDHPSGKPKYIFSKLEGEDE